MPPALLFFFNIPLAYTVGGNASPQIHFSPPPTLQKVVDFLFVEL